MADAAEHALILAAAGVSGQEACELVRRFGSAEKIIAASPAENARAGVSETAIRQIRHPDPAMLDVALQWHDLPNHHIVAIYGPDYPELLRQVVDAPVLLYVVGDPGVLHLPALAIVGSRNPTRGGIQNAHDFAAHLGRSGFCIHSGLAQGIDTAAHKGALDADAKTVAFLGHGIDRVYPAENRDLAHRIADLGALVAEFPLGSPPRRENFPQRNRLISGCTMGTLVVEAAFRSGSLITARLASDQGREVFAIPGSIHNALARGCHRLIRSGAKLVESADDVVSELGAIAGYLMQNTEDDDSTPIISKDRDDDYKLLIKTMAHDPATADEIAEKSGLTIDQVSSMLLILELEGEIEALNGGQYAILKETLLA